MPTPTYLPIQSFTLTSSANNIGFANIPLTFKDLVLTADVSNSNSLSAGSIAPNLIFNGVSSGQVYISTRMNLSGSSPTVTGSWTSLIPLGTYPDATRNYSVIELNDYAVTNKKKSGIYRTYSQSQGVLFTTFNYESTTAITSINVRAGDNGLFLTGSVFTLYGIVG